VKINWTGIVAWFAARASEPSTYAGLAALAVAAGLPATDGVTVTKVGAYIAGAIAVVFAEGGQPPAAA
jgi:hypothetical protein